MADIRPFRALRPVKDYAQKIAALPYDVYDRSEALAEVTREPLSFLHIDRPETWFDDSVDIYDPAVYEKAGQVLHDFMARGYFCQDAFPCYYIYEQIMDGRSQTGLVACASVNDYLQGKIKRHEKTREEKEQDRIRHIEACRAQTGPIFLAYREDAVIKRLIAEKMKTTPVYDFAAADGVIQRVWVISDKNTIDALRSRFQKIHALYIADGHHRAASAVRVAQRHRRALGLAEDEAAGDENDVFLCVFFPHKSLKILPYNRIVKDLNGYTPEAFLEALARHFDVIALGSQTPGPAPFPDKRGSMGMYLLGQWYLLEEKSFKAEPTTPVPDAVGRLDVSVLQEKVLGPLLGIKDPRLDRRIDFIGGIGGLKALEASCKDRGWAVAFAMYPMDIEELFAVADAGGLMPPKSTWFEPKLRSGLFIHLL